MSEAAELERVVRTLTAEQQAGCLRFVLGYMSGKPEWSALKEAVDLYTSGKARLPHHPRGHHE